MKIYLARGTELPEFGKPITAGFLQRLKKNGEWEFLRHTSEVQALFPIGDGIYFVKTRKGTIYIYQHFNLEDLRKAYENSEE